MHITDRDTGLSVPTKVLVLALAIATASQHLRILPMLALNLSMIAYMVLARQKRMAVGMLAYLAIIGPVYAAYTIWGVRPFILSPIQINQMWSVFSVMGAVCVLFMTPPGLISAALARIRCPKKIILGTLVFLRFFPTFAATWRLLRDALCKRGLATARRMIANPIDTYEYVMVPILLSLISSADQLSSSAVTRAAEAPMARTSYYAQPLRLMDATCAIGAAALCIGVVVANGTLA